MSCSEEDNFQGPPQGVPALREEGPGLEYVKQFKAHKALVSSFASQVTADQGQEQTVPGAKWAWEMCLVGGCGVYWKLEATEPESRGLGRQVLFTARF